MAPHFLFLPFPGQGHINPMLNFASHLVALVNCKITFVNTERSARAMQQAISQQHEEADAVVPKLDSAANCNDAMNDDGIRFVTISDGMSHDPCFKLDMSFEAFARLLAGIQQQQGVLEELVESSMATHKPISCIVSDMYFPWMQDVADKFSIPRAVFWTSNATSFHLCCLARSNKIYPLSPEVEELEAKLQLDKSHLLDKYYYRDEAELEVLERMEEAAYVLINTFDNLECARILSSCIASKVKYIGPCFEPEKSNKNAGELLRRTLLKEDSECLGWLDKQGENSVLYIAFGSVAHLPPSQIEELALGLEASEQRFLWVARPGTTFPEGFKERTKGRGLIISWAPQLSVLGHSSVGGFLTHCGWNSMLESVCLGVPMLCLPIFSDQPVNAQLVERHWRVGMRMTKLQGCSNACLVGRMEVERCVKALLTGHEGRSMRERASHLKQAALHALHDKEGSFHLALASFLKEIG